MFHKRYPVRSTKNVVPFGANSQLEEGLAKQAASLIVDKQIKAELGYGFLIGRQIGRVTERIDAVTNEPTVRNFYVLYRTIRSLDALTEPYTSPEYKEKRRQHIITINGLGFDVDRQDRDMAIDICQSWFADLIADLHRAGMLFKESVGVIL